MQNSTQKLKKIGNSILIREKMLTILAEILRSERCKRRKPFVPQIFLAAPEGSGICLPFILAAFVFAIFPAFSVEAGGWNGRRGFFEFPRPTRLSLRDLRARARTCRAEHWISKCRWARLFWTGYPRRP